MSQTLKFEREKNERIFLRFTVLHWMRRFPTRVCTKSLNEIILLHFEKSLKDGEDHLIPWYIRNYFLPDYNFKALISYIFHAIQIFLHVLFFFIIFYFFSCFSLEMLYNVLIYYTLQVWVYVQLYMRAILRNRKFLLRYETVTIVF